MAAEIFENWRPSASYIDWNAHFTVRDQFHTNHIPSSTSIMSSNEFPVKLHQDLSDNTNEAFGDIFIFII